MFHQEKFPGLPGEKEARTTRDLRGGPGESIRRPGMPQRSRRGAMEAQGPVECEKGGNPNSLEGKAGWERGSGRPLQRDLGVIPGSELLWHC